jgi:hypothetical protein
LKGEGGKERGREGGREGWKAMLAEGFDAPPCTVNVEME